ncbi:MAG: Ig-like domain-containing protein [Flavipsychrobacter sp.]|nr:Ig-like domain-containing protein [Flavipsychrobacter sp.]
MKHAKLSLITLLLTFFTAMSSAFAAKTYVPSSQRSMSSASSYCQGTTANSIRFRYYTCNSGSGSSDGVSMTVNWYRNSVNSTTGGTLVSTSTRTSTTSSSGSLSYRPSTSTVGVSYYYCVITWTGSGTCNTSGTLTSSTTQVTVAAAPGTIGGSNTPCVAAATTYTNSATGGTWSTSSSSRATIGATTGILTGVSAGTVYITYRGTCGSRVTKLVTVTATPTVASISGGTSKVCAGSTTTLSNSTSGGVWSSSNTAVGTVSTSGVVRGISSGITTISYEVSSACGTVYATKDVTVTATPAAISGVSSACTGYTTLYSNTVPYGNWTSSNTSKATINATTGMITAISAGTTRISYSTGCGAMATKVLTVNAGVAANTGTSSVCEGATTTLSNSVSGGTWSAANTDIANVGETTGVVAGVSEGTTTITYSTGGSCNAVTTVTVKATPAAIDGSSTVCTGGGTTLFSNTTLFGTWSSSTPSVATINTNSGLATGMVQGTTRITYTTGCGTAATKLLTVYTQPAAITGTASVCVGATTTLSNSISGGAWSSSDETEATISASGEVTGISEGVVTATYTNGVCYATRHVTVNPLADAGVISGDFAVCDGDDLAFSSDGDADGTWTSSSSSVATVEDDGSGLAKSAGTATITYSVSNGCGTVRATAVLTVSEEPTVGTISGTATVCEDATTTITASGFSEAGVWTSSNGSVATVGTTGVVSGVTPGTSSIMYTVTNGCGSVADTMDVTVNPLPSAGTISGTAIVCEAATTTLAGSVSGGVWTSSNSAVATVNAEGNVTGVAAGTAVITYTVSNDCGSAYATQMVTVNPLPSAGAISGTAIVCEAATTTLTSTVDGGVWSSSNSSVATVGTNGVVNGVAAGNATISYSHTNSCGTAYTTQVVTVNSVPSAGTISGTTVLCAATTTTLSTTEGGGAWSSSDAAIATVDAGGVVNGVSAGTATISYGASNSCGSNYASVVVTVNPSSATITGSASVCLGGAATYTISDPSGSWTSSNPAVASVDAATGVVNGLAIGSVTISYSAATGCYVATQTLNVYNSVGEITGSVFACEGVTSALSCATTGGTWSSNNAAIASVDASGVVTAVSAGSAFITYTVAGGCYTTTTFVVWPMPAAITGINTVCTGSSTVLYSTIGGSGTWSSNDVAVATADLTSGMINGLTSGTSTITYKIPASGCQVTTVVTVNETPAAISGANTICVGSTSVYSSATTGGTWSSNPSSVATIDGSTGLATAATAGVTTISYVMPTGCFTTKVITANPLPASITFAANNVCLGKTMTFASATAGGTWSSSNTTVATIASTGVATSQDLGTTDIIYTLPTGCAKTAAFTIFSGVSAIGGGDMVAKGTSMTLTNATTGGAWSSGNTAIISVNSVTGVVTGMAAGSARISYKLLGGCLSYKVMTVAGITGTPRACVGTTTTLGHLMSGTWSSANTAIATVDATTGVVTGIAPGNAVISYNLGSGVVNTITVVVYALPAPISGASAICADASSLYTGTVGGSATWSSSDVSVVRIGSTSGMATGVSAGSAILTYKIPASGCFTTRAVTVNPAPSAITGSATACVGATVALSNDVEGGVWSSSPTTVATVGSSTGVVTAAAAGGVTISYTLANGCRKTRVLTVNASPAAISGPSVLSPGSSSAFSCGSAGGSWSVSDESVASILTASGGSANVRGNGSGTAQVWYRLANGCGRSKEVSVVGAKTAPVAEEVLENVFNVYPNPTSGVINVESSVAGSFSVYTFDGKQVSEFQIGANTTTVNLPSGLAAGVYICQFRFEDGTSKTVKLFYQN